MVDSDSVEGVVINREPKLWIDGNEELRIKLLRRYLFRVTVGREVLLTGCLPPTQAMELLTVLREYCITCKTKKDEYQRQMTEMAFDHDI